jgi:hypothetical protein
VSSHEQKVEIRNRNGKVAAGKLADEVGNIANPVERTLK